MADVPVGIVLSGGLDSSLVAAVAHEAAERAGQPVPACWTVAESEENPDWKAAELVAPIMTSTITNISSNRMLSNSACLGWPAR